MKAFPQINKFWKNENDFCYEVSSSEGMDLRDYFAAKAMQGWCTQPADEFNSFQHVAQRAYEMADQMMKARENNE